MASKALAEFIGTFALVFFGTGAIIVNDVSGGLITHPGIAITFGLVVIAMIYAFGEISGAHINPAVTIAFWFSGRFAGALVLPFIISQTAGALAASSMLYYIFPQHETLGTTLPAIDVSAAFVLELLLTFFLMLVIINVSTGSKEIGVMAGIAIGFTVLICAMFAGPVTGASMNPARSLSAALISGHTEFLWLYITAPIAGALLAILVCRVIKGKDCCPVPMFYRSRKIK